MKKLIIGALGLVTIIALSSTLTFSQNVVITNNECSNSNVSSDCENSKSKLFFSQNTLAPFSVDTSDSWSVSWIDYNNDGNDDLFFTNKNSKKTSLLYRNNGNSTFTKITTNNAVTTLSTACTSTWADIDNDGDLDLFIANDTKFMNELFINDGVGNFTLSKESGLSNSVGYYQAASWVDYDLDGFVDLFVGNYFATRFNELYHNNGNKTFTKVTNTPITRQQGSGVGATWADYDNDGFPDLFVPNNQQSKNQLYHNNGNGNFTIVTNNPIVNDGGASVASCWGDIDNDGDLDLFVANSNVLFGSYLYRNDGNGVFTKITNSVVTQGGHSHGCNFVDLDNDADLDLLVCNDVGLKFLYINNGSGVFTEKKDESICKDYGFAFANSWSDFDKDGDMDVAIATHSNQKNMMFVNNCTNINSYNWISLKLIGLISNKSAIGARIKIVTGSRSQIAEINAQSGFGGQNSLWNHFGLNSSSVIDSIIIKWPSGIQQIILKQRVNQFITINEMSSAKITGNVFQDANNNCTIDGKEKGIANVKIKVTPGNIYTTTDKSGNYSLRLAPGNYTISVVTPTNFSTSCVNKYIITIRSTETVSGKNFALKSSKNGSDMYTNVSATALRRGMKNMIVVEYGNIGNQVSCIDTLKIVADSTLKILSADKPWNFKNNNVYSWIISNVNAGETFTIQMIDSVSKRVEIGTMININATITSHCGDLNTANNQNSFRQKTVGAIDPNEMLVRTSKNDNADVVSKADTLHYRINFQNVGNYEATNIAISSAIPDGLDASTFTDEISSHLHHVSINGNIITWQFDSIALPDSSTNQIGSNGFIEFSFVPKSDINIGDVILNSAQIQFDYENPLATNKVKSVIAASATGLNSALQLFPNPTNSFINISVGSDSDNTPLHLANFSIFNINGQLIEQHNSTALFERVDVSGLQNGWYIINAIDELGNQHSNKFIKE